MYASVRGKDFKLYLNLNPIGPWKGLYTNEHLAVIVA